MRNFRFLAALVAGTAWTSRAAAQQTSPAPPQAQGFAVDRFYPSAPGAGWFVMDDLDLKGGIGGAVALSSGYAYKPLTVLASDGGERLAVVRHQAFADVSLALTYDAYRVYASFTSPLVIRGDGGMAGAYQLTAPLIDAGNSPDLLSDVRVGFDALLLGNPGEAFRLGAGAQLIIPNGNRSDYNSDEIFRSIIRALFAGDVGSLSYAGQLGVHVRPLDDPTLPGNPRGGELLFGLAGGARLPLNASSFLVVGPEVFGETAFRGFFGSETTGFEGLLSGRIETTGDEATHFRVKLGAGGGLHPRFGAPELRVVLALELFGRTAK